MKHYHTKTLARLQTIWVKWLCTPYTRHLQNRVTKRMYIHVYMCVYVKQYANAHNYVIHSVTMHMCVYA